MENNIPLLLVTGKSGSGKDFIVNKLNIPYVVSRTTREPRTNEINGKDKVFTTVNEFTEICKNSIDSIIAYGVIHNNIYFTLTSDLNHKIAYIIDYQGIQSLLENQHKINREFIIVYIYCKWYKRLYRLIKRQGWKFGISRFWNDIWNYRIYKYDIKIIN